MRILRNIAFLLSLLVMIGHDFVPHVHEHLHELQEDLATIPNIPSSDFKDITDAFAHFQHNPTEKHITYVTGSEQQTNLHVADLCIAPGPVIPQSGIVWFSNLKKQHFSYDVEVPPGSHLHASRHRGPPAC